MTEQFKLQPADILVSTNDRGDLYSRVKRWGVGPYDHVSLYLGRMGLFTDRGQRRILRVPMLFESYGRGCALRSLSERYGQKVVVLRLKSEHDKRRISRVLEEAVKLASDSQSYYDYSVVFWHIIPRLVFEKLGLTPPLKYQRDERQVCSEAVMEVFLRAKIEILSPSVVPLPGDFITASLLEKVFEGNLDEMLV